MTNGKDLFSQIHEAYDRLPKKQKKIADYISSNVQEVIFYSISELAAVLETSEAAVVRFAQNLGYSGYPQLRKILIQYYKEHLSAANRIKSYLGGIKGHDFIYPDMVRKEIALHVLGHNERRSGRRVIYDLHGRRVVGQ